MIVVSIFRLGSSLLSVFADYQYWLGKKQERAGPKTEDYLLVQPALFCHRAFGMPGDVVANHMDPSREFPGRGPNRAFYRAWD